MTDEDDQIGEMWPYLLVETASFHHLGWSQTCVGECLITDGRASCYACGWRCSARLEDVDADAEASGRFVFFMLATVGRAIALGIKAATERRA